MMVVSALSSVKIIDVVKPLRYCTKHTISWHVSEIRRRLYECSPPLHAVGDKSECRTLCGMFITMNLDSGQPLRSHRPARLSAIYTYFRYNYGRLSLTTCGRTVVTVSPFLRWSTWIHTNVQPLITIEHFRPLYESMFEVSSSCAGRFCLFQHRAKAAGHHVAKVYTEELPERLTFDNLVKCIWDVSTERLCVWDIAGT